MLPEMFSKGLGFRGDCEKLIFCICNPFYMVVTKKQLFEAGVP